MSKTAVLSASLGFEGLWTGQSRKNNYSGASIRPAGLIRSAKYFEWSD